MFEGPPLEEDLLEKFVDWLSPNSPLDLLIASCEEKWQTILRDQRMRNRLHGVQQQYQERWSDGRVLMPAAGHKVQIVLRNRNVGRKLYVVEISI